MILAGLPQTSTGSVLTRTHVVHVALRKILGDLDYGLSAVRVYADHESVIVMAPNSMAAARWEITYPAGHVLVADHPVPLHIAVEGDIEGGAL